MIFKGDPCLFIERIGKSVDLRTVAKLMGHRDIKMTMRYAHLAPEHLQAAVDILEVRSESEVSRATTG